MYNKELADNIFDVLNRYFPRRPGLRELRSELPRYSDLPDEDWLLAVDALIQDGSVDGTQARPGQKKVLMGIADLYVTPLGRRQVVDIPLRLEDDLREETSTLDSLLQIHTRGQFDRDLDESFTLHSQSASPFSLVFADLDDFKRINDTYGHPIGDKALQTAAAIFKSVSEGKGKCYRYGGDELTILLPNYTLTEAIALAERIRVELYETQLENVAQRITASFGVASYPESTNGTGELVGCADRALYKAKGAGGNQVCKAEPAQRERDVQIAPIGDTQKRVDAVELRISLLKGAAADYTISVRNDSNEDVLVAKIDLVTRGIQLTEPARPRENDDWKVPARSGR